MNSRELLEDFQVMASDEPDPEDDEAMFCPHCGEQLAYTRTDLLDRRLPCSECGKIIDKKS